MPSESASSRTSRQVSGRVVYRSRLAAVAPNPGPVPVELRPAQIARFKQVLAEAMLDINRIAERQTTIVGRLWAEAVRKVLESDAWTGRVVHLIDTAGLHAGEAAVQAGVWLARVTASAGPGEVFVQVAAWVQVRLQGLAEPVPEGCVLALDGLGPEDVLVTNLVRPVAVVAAEMKADGLALDCPIVVGSLPPDGEDVTIADGVLRMGRPAGGPALVTPALYFNRWEELAAVVLAPAAVPLLPPGAYVGVNLDKLSRSPLHPGFLKLLFLANRKVKLAVGGKAAFDPDWVPLWAGMGVQAWFSLEGEVPCPVPSGVAKAAWRAVAPCRTPAEVRKALAAVRKKYR